MTRGCSPPGKFSLSLVQIPVKLEFLNRVLAARAEAAAFGLHACMKTLASDWDAVTLVRVMRLIPEKTIAMRITDILQFLAFTAFGAAQVTAQENQLGERWSFAERTEFMENVAWNYGRLNGGLSEIGVECSEEVPVVYFADGQRHDGDARQGRVAISIDGQDYSRRARFIPHGHVS